MILAEISFLLPAPRRHPSSPRSILLIEIPSYLCALLGLYLCSFPEHFPEQRPWSRQLLKLGLAIFPKGSFLYRFWAGLGAQLLCLAILMSPSMRRALSSRPLQWLGTISYSLYLVHGTLIRTVLTWLVFGPMALSPSARVQTELADIPLIAQPPAAVIMVILVIFWPVMLAGVRVWSVKVEPLFGRLTAWFEQFAGHCGDDESRSGKKGWEGSVKENWGKYDDDMHSLPLSRPAAGPNRQPQTAITPAYLDIRNWNWENALSRSG